MFYPSFLSAFVSFLVGAALLYFLLPILRRYLLDQPIERSAHQHPIPRGGGSVFVLVSTFSGLLACIYYLLYTPSPAFIFAAPLFAFPLAIVGLLDDRYNISALWRYGVQLITAVLILFASPLIDLSVSTFFIVFLSLISITAIINFTNFMDGVDGLVAGCMAVALTSTAIYLSAPWSLWSLVGSLCGFLIWNWCPAKVFMGDVGSTFLGAVFAFLVFQSSTWLDAFSLLFVATPILGDACICVLRRFIARQPVFQGHRLHLFQRLHQAGWTHSQVSIVYIIATAALSLALLFGGTYAVFYLVVVELLIGFWLDQRVAVPFVIVSRS